MLLSRKGSKKMEGACIIQKNTLTRMVTDQLRQDILLGQIASGSRITVQSIAKRYNTSVEGIVQENSLEGDTVPEKRTLLIPIVSE